MSTRRMNDQSIVVNTATTEETNNFAVPVVNNSTDPITPQKQKTVSYITISAYYSNSIYCVKSSYIIIFVVISYVFVFVKR